MNGSQITNYITPFRSEMQFENKFFKKKPPIRQSNLKEYIVFFENWSAN